jgi:hypothetical protein
MFPPNMAGRYRTAQDHQREAVGVRGEQSGFRAMPDSAFDTTIVTGML